MLMYKEYPETLIRKAPTNQACGSYPPKSKVIHQLSTTRTPFVFVDLQGSLMSYPP
jgi:hypothetical protein